LMHALAALSNAPAFDKNYLWLNRGETSHGLE
jgi:hypothetical protein